MGFVDGKWRQDLHLEPPKGWLNDPNGLSYFDGYYHVYFQYAPDSASGNSKKYWGHYRSADFTNWEFTGIVLLTDTPEDRDGVYSGCGVVDKDKLHLFYTGNVKEKGDFDYVTAGRGANVIHVTTEDSVNMSCKEVLLRNSDYPNFCSCHVRDPKVWLEDGKWHMVLGARTLNDEGCVLFYTSDDLENWKYSHSEAVPDFGYMWECPDVFKIDGKKYLSVSPQGLEHQETKYQNVYQSGYFRYDDKPVNFVEWDKGFDFYAPQTFEAPDGRRILIAWMGIGDIPYSNPTVELGYQHCLTIPREITADESGNLLQNPIKELESLRREKDILKSGESTEISYPFELVANVNDSFAVSFDNAVKLCWNGKLLSLTFSDDEVGQGRDARKSELDKCENIRIIADKSSLEIYLDNGRVVMSSRMYPDEEKSRITVNGLDATLYSLDKMQIKYN